MSLDQEIKRKHKINKIRNVPPSVSSVANKEQRKIVKYKDQWSFSTDRPSSIQLSGFRNNIVLWYCSVSKQNSLLQNFKESLNILTREYRHFPL